ncbi:eukaryotic translation initiation factor 2-alpha kinase 3-like [Kryptolebias marmoratus]|uniref:eukaryotic translation initiation factor 2-alpha kinase 3-like n=1 Tax=Kryptolebias marmoratus TaxID=37003 RepID=UPI0007F92E59|nr:eukaryotic translation initiation factor 2-alpha kinase 3-like [Kryptolebias marmoratus]
MTLVHHDGVLLTSTQGIMGQWAEYFEDFFNPTSMSSSEKAELGDLGPGSPISGAEAENASNVATKSRFISDFEVIARLGKGGFGSVYEVKQKLLDKHFAVKIVRFRDFREARKEVEVLSDLHHPNIVRYFECWVDSEYQDEYRVSSSSSESKSGASKQYLYIMLELCEPVNLGGRIKDMNKEGLEGFGRRRQILPIAQEIVSGVEYFHFKKLIHRDLKPSNIMFGKDGKVKIGDFGLVTTDTSDDDENQMDRTEGAGTKPYMAPEQKSRKYDRKVDMFALGLIFFELLWKISTVTVTEKSKIWTDLRSRKFPEEFVGTFYQEYKIIKSLLSENPEDRQEAAVLQAELKGLISRDSEDQENRTV